MTSLRFIAAVVVTGMCLPAASAESFDAKGVKIHYITEGKGEPVVLIHGLLSSVDINWKLTGVVGELARDHRVIALDLPGHGRSDKPANDDAYGLQVVEDVILLLDHLKVQKAHVVGYSLGGMVAVKLMAKYPDRVLSCLVGGMGWFRDGSPLQKFWERVPARDGNAVPKEFTRNIGKLAVSEAELKKISLPVEVFVGDRDPVKQMYVVPLQRVRKDWPVVEIADAGHMDCIVKKQFREEIGSWVRKNSK
jgi:pimeloyl-ACP methyl ester carboxylesterase